MTRPDETLRPWWRSRTISMAALLCIVGIATRIPFRAQILHHWDSVNFALALEHFDVRLHQPHPPGTFVIYILLGRLFNSILHNPNDSLVWLSVILSGLGVAALYLLGEAMFGRKVGLVAALLAVASPLVWFHGEIALSYMLEFFWVPIVVLLCYRLQTSSWQALLVSALLIGMAGGVRPNTPVFLFPLWAVGVIIHKYPLKRILIALLVMAAGVMIWAVPMVVMSGGLAEYIGVMRWWQDQHTEGSASLYGIAENVVRFVLYIVYTVGLGLVPLAIAAVRSLPNALRHLRTDWRAQALASWILPATGYFTIIHLRQPGHTFTIQPAFLLLCSLAIVSFATRRESARWNAWAVLTALLVVVNALVFLVGPRYLFGDTRMLFTLPTRSAIREYDTYVTARLNVIREAFSPHETAVLAAGRDFRLPDYYLRDYQVPSLSHDVDKAPVTLEEPVSVLVFFDDSAIPELPAGIELQSVVLPGSEVLHYIAWDETQVIELSQGLIEVKDE